jgi:hypothetical protein
MYSIQILVTLVAEPVSRSFASASKLQAEKFVYFLLVKGGVLVPDWPIDSPKWFARLRYYKNGLFC